MTTKAMGDGGVTTGPGREFGYPKPFRDPTLASTCPPWTHEICHLPTDRGDLNNLTDLHDVVAARETLERVLQDVPC